MEYSEFKNIIETMKEHRYDFEADIKRIQNTAKLRKNGEKFPLSKHIEWLVFAQLSNNRPWQGIEDNRSNIEKIFHNFDPEFLKKASPDALRQELIEIKCGNRQIKPQMNNLGQNIKTLERIARENGGSIDNYFNKFNKASSPLDLAKKLSENKKDNEYKLKYIGLPLACEYIKSAGIDIIKPDVHVCRLLKRLGYIKPASQKSEEKEAVRICEEIAKEYNVSSVYVDTALWQYCAEKKFEMCTEANPKCGECKVKNCNNRMK